MADTVSDFFFFLNGEKPKSKQTKLINNFNLISESNVKEWLLLSNIASHNGCQQEILRNTELKNRLGHFGGNWVVILN